MPITISLELIDDELLQDLAREILMAGLRMSQDPASGKMTDDRRRMATGYLLASLAGGLSSEAVVRGVAFTPKAPRRTQ